MEETQIFKTQSSLQNRNENTISQPQLYVHPLVQRSSILMNQINLEICTESLGSESGSDEFFYGDQLDSFKTENEEEDSEEAGEELDQMDIKQNDNYNVNYHCHIGRRSHLRLFPPPLPSISRSDGQCFKMQPHRQCGRLIIEAVPVRSVNYLHAERRNGHLLLYIVGTSTRTKSNSSLKTKQENNERYEEILKKTELDEIVVEEEEVVINRETILEAKVSTQAAVKVHRPYLVINKFVVGTPTTEQNLVGTGCGGFFRKENELRYQDGGSVGCGGVINQSIDFHLSGVSI